MQYNGNAASTISTTYLLHIKKKWGKVTSLLPTEYAAPSNSMAHSVHPPLLLTIRSLINIHPSVHPYYIHPHIFIHPSIHLLSKVCCEPYKIHSRKYMFGSAAKHPSPTKALLPSSEVDRRRWRRRAAMARWPRKARLRVNGDGDNSIPSKQADFNRLPSVVGEHSRLLPPACPRLVFAQSSPYHYYIAAQRPRLRGVECCTRQPA